jgi:23S rRNA pseudouridine1911/1915/1917 synthase
MAYPKKNLTNYTKGMEGSAGGTPGENGSEADVTNSRTLLFVIPVELAGLRLDQALAKILPQYSRSRLQDWIARQHVMLDGAHVSSKQKVWGGEELSVLPVDHPEDQPFRAENIVLDILYEDDELLVINKPVGLVVHPGSGNWAGTMLNALLHYAPQLANVPRAGIVHRLDKDTSGLLVVAKTIGTQTALVRQLDARSVRREYLALAHGEIKQSGTINAPIGRHPVQRVKMAVIENGKHAITHYHIEERFPGCTLLRCLLETGRTHQIRVHLAHAGHPIVGDQVYKMGPTMCPPQLRQLMMGFPRQALHATRLALEHPLTGRMIDWYAPLPADMQQLLQWIKAIGNEPA